MSNTGLICVALACVGVVIGVSVNLSKVSTDDAATTTQPVAGSVSKAARLQAAADSPAGATVTLNADQLRALMREEVSAALASQAGQQGGNARGSVQPVSLQTANTPELLEQRREAMESAKEIITSGQWGDEERRTFHQKLAMLEPAQVEEAMQQLVKAIDSGSVNVLTQGPPL